MAKVIRNKNLAEKVGCAINSIYISTEEIKNLTEDAEIIKLVEFIRSRARAVECDILCDDCE